MGSGIWILVEAILVFVIIWLFNYYSFVQANKKLNKDDMPLELIYLEGIWKIDPTKINYRRFQITYCFINAFIITCVHLLVFYLVKNKILKIVMWVVLLSLFIIVCYGLLGKYYLYKEKKMAEEDNKDKNKNSEKKVTSKKKK